MLQSLEQIRPKITIENRLNNVMGRLECVFNAITFIIIVNIHKLLREKLCIFTKIRMTISFGLEKNVLAVYTTDINRIFAKLILKNNNKLIMRTIQPPQPTVYDRNSETGVR